MKSLVKFMYSVFCMQKVMIQSAALLMSVSLNSPPPVFPAQVGELHDISDNERAGARLHRNHGCESQESQYSKDSHQMFLTAMAHGLSTGITIRGPYAVSIEAIELPLHSWRCQICIPATG